MNEKSVVVSVTTEGHVTTSYQNFSLGELQEILTEPSKGDAVDLLENDFDAFFEYLSRQTDVTKKGT